MSNVLIGVIGVVLFIGLALAGALFLGSRFSNATNDASATRYVNEGQQISRAFELFGLNTGSYPDGTGETGTANQAILNQLLHAGYLKAIPAGAGTQAAPSWYVDTNVGAAMTAIGSDSQSQSICASARRQAGFTDAIHDCTDTTITDKDPCCSSAS